MVTRKPLACNNLASEAAMIPFPKLLVTPPVTKIYLDILLFSKKLCVYLSEDPLSAAVRLPKGSTQFNRREGKNG
jgi:hypothetical protein